VKRCGVKVYEFVLHVFESFRMEYLFIIHVLPVKLIFDVSLDLLQ